ncbi:MAG: AMP-binding protein [Deltaproteobacteria bacterium]|nr:AMP-binding protein [Deltaproteobacteria bacterium]
MPGARWFPGARLNFAENMLRFRDDHPAVIFRAENGSSRRLSYAELQAQTAWLAAALRDLGVGAGDRVAGFLPNLPETVVAMLAATSLGATWSSCSPDFGFRGVMDRFCQVRPKVLFTADGYFYGGKTFDSLARVAEIKASLASLAQVVVAPFTQEAPDLSPVPGAVLFPDLLGRGAPPARSFAPLPPDHPLYVLYSSGTTGVPKCLVHGAGYVLVQHLKELGLHSDLRLAFLSRAGGALGLRGPGEDHHLRRQRPLSGGHREPRAEAGRAIRPGRLADHPVHRVSPGRR